jgi:hypothetical protein
MTYYFKYLWYLIQIPIFWLLMMIPIPGWTIAAMIWDFDLRGPQPPYRI